MESISIPLASLIDWGWLQIGPYIHINIDPVIFFLGPLAVRWYGLMYVVAIVMGLWLLRKYIARQRILWDQAYRMLWWCVVAGVVGGRLYFVIQQPDLVQNYLLKPQHILATWEGGMAFYGAVFLIIPVLFWRAIKERLNPLVVLDAGALFAAYAQPFARIGNIINGDIIGYPSTLPWSTVYDHPASWACRNQAAGTCHIPVQPASAYEILANLLLIGILLLLVRRYRRPGMLLLTYLGGYALTQFLVFFTRANTVVSLFTLDWGLKQAQWTSLIVLLLLIPLTLWVRRWRFAQPIPKGEIPATYGMPPSRRKAVPATIKDE
ncbi:MAG: prolipoprotein diacylglyceryl transferase [Ktedonobacteraceae bacterium]|nr:prolipoprotein diacylglyceryl transferase [Ktedonobacteraceae bacterium]